MLARTAGLAAFTHNGVESAEPSKQSSGESILPAFPKGEASIAAQRYVAGHRFNTHAPTQRAVLGRED